MSRSTGRVVGEAAAIQNVLGLEEESVAALVAAYREGRVSAYSVLRGPEFAGDPSTFLAASRRLERLLETSSPPTSGEVATRLRELIAKAYETLSVPERRANYDAWLRWQREMLSEAATSPRIEPSQGVPTQAVPSGQRWPLIAGGTVLAALTALIGAAMLGGSPTARVAHQDDSGSVNASQASELPSPAITPPRSESSPPPAIISQSRGAASSSVAPSSSAPSASNVSSTAISVPTQGTRLEPVRRSEAAAEATGTASPADSTPAVRKYAMFVAVKKYLRAEMNKPQLDYPEADAKALEQFFVRSGYFVDLLLGPQATQEAIRAKLAALPRKGTSNGVVVVGLFGHGVEFESTAADGTKARTAYYCPHDALVQLVRDSDGKLRTGPNGEPLIEPTPDSLVSMSEVLRSLRVAGAPNRVVLADCCRTLANRPQGRAFGADFNTSALPPGTSVLFACSPNEQAFEHRDWGHGAFTRCLLDELPALAASNEADTGMLASRLKTKVPELVATTSSRGTQNPQAYLIDTVDFQLTIDPAARTANPAPGSTPGESKYAGPMFAPSEPFEPIVKGNWRFLETGELESEMPYRDEQVMLFGDPSWTNYDFEVEVIEDQPAVGGPSAERGFAVCAVDEPTKANGAKFWMFNIGSFGSAGNTDLVPLGTSGNPYKTSERRWRPNSVQVERGRWYPVKMEVRDGDVATYFNGWRVSTSWHRELAAGRVGLRTWSDGRVRWRHPVVKAVDGTTLRAGWPKPPLRLSDPPPIAPADATAHGIDAKEAWQCPIAVKPGDKVIVTAEGSWRWGSAPQSISGPRGATVNGGLQVAQLECRLAGWRYSIGAGATLLVDQAGDLQFRMYDTDYADNDGIMTLHVAVERPATAVTVDVESPKS